MTYYCTVISDSVVLKYVTYIAIEVKSSAGAEDFMMRAEVSTHSLAGFYLFIA